MTRRANGEGNIGKRKDGTYYGSMLIGGKRRWVTGKNRKMVVDGLRKLHQEYEHSKSTADNQTVGSFLQQWLDAVVVHRNKPKTHDSYSSMIRLHITPHIGAYQLNKLEVGHIQELLNTLAGKTYGKQHKTLSARTIQYARTILVRAFNYAIKQGVLTRNVAALTEPPHRDRPQIKPLDEHQARRLLDAVAGDRLELLYRVALSLGLRRGEILALQWHDVDFNGKLLYVRANLQRISGKLVRGTTKTNRVRTLPVPDTLLDALRSHKEHDTHTCDTDYVFTSTHGTAIDPDNLRHAFKRILQRAELPQDTRFHDLRHSCATLMLAQGIPLRIIMEILGHTNISTTADIYTHVPEGVNRDALDRLQIMFSKKDKT